MSRLFLCFFLFIYSVNQLLKLFIKLFFKSLLLLFLPKISIAYAELLRMENRFAAFSLLPFVIVERTYCLRRQQQYGKNIYPGHQPHKEPANTVRTVTPRSIQIITRSPLSLTRPSSDNSG